MSLKNQIIISVSFIFNLFSYSYAAATPRQFEDDTTIQNAVVSYINEYRQQHGLPKLTMNENIVIQAKKHSQDMANHRMGFSHQDFDKRITKLHQQIKGSDGGAENIAYNYKSARDVVSQWILSPGHKRNIVGPYNLTGVGVAHDKQGKLYYTQMFLHVGKKFNNSTTHTVQKSFFRSSFFSMRKNG